MIKGIAEEGLKETGVIYQYKTGAITTDEFRTKLNNIIVTEGGNKLEDSEFDSCWNAMCQIDKFSLPDNFMQKDIYLHVIGDTNELQHKFIQEGLRQHLEGANLKISYTLSFEEKSSDQTSLKEAAEQYITANYPDSEIIWCNNNKDQDLNKIIGKLTEEQVNDSNSCGFISDHNDEDNAQSLEKLDVGSDVNILGNYDIIEES